MEHLRMLNNMGITTLTLADGRVQLLHTLANVIYLLYNIIINSLIIFFPII